MKEFYGFVIETRKLIEHGTFDRVNGGFGWRCKFSPWELRTNAIYTKYQDALEVYDSIPNYGHNIFHNEYRIKPLYTSVHENEESKNEYAKVRVIDALNKAAENAKVEDYYSDPFLPSRKRVNKFSITSIIDNLKF